MAESSCPIALNSNGNQLTMPLTQSRFSILALTTNTVDTAAVRQNNCSVQFHVQGLPAITGKPRSGCRSF